MRSTALVREVGTAVVVIGSVLAVLLGSAPLMWGAQALRLVPAEGRPGDQVRVDRELVAACRIDEATTTTITWEGRGQHDETRRGVAADIAVPEVPPGAYRVTLECLRDDGDPDGPALVASRTGRFTVLAPELPPATVTLSPAAAEPGVTVTATGQNYTEKCFPDAVSVRVGGTPVQLTRGPDRGGSGELTVEFAVPDLPPRTVRVELACADERSATAMLEVLSLPVPPVPAPGPVPPLPPQPGPDPIPPGPDSLVGPGGDGIGRSTFVRSVPVPAEVRWTVPALLVSLALFAFLFWALGFPSEPFNKTLEENRD